MTNYKAMNYEQLSREAERLLAIGWFKNIQELNFIYKEMKLRLR